MQYNGINDGIIIECKWDNHKNIGIVMPGLSCQRAKSWENRERYWIIMDIMG